MKKIVYRIFLTETVYKNSLTGFFAEFETTNYAEAYNYVKNNMDSFTKFSVRKVAIVTLNDDGNINGYYDEFQIP